MTVYVRSRSLAARHLRSVRTWAVYAPPDDDDPLGPLAKSVADFGALCLVFEPDDAPAVAAGLDALADSLARSAPTNPHATAAAGALSRLSARVSRAPSRPSRR